MSGAVRVISLSIVASIWNNSFSNAGDPLAARSQSPQGLRRFRDGSGGEGQELTVLGDSAGAERWVGWVCCIRPAIEEAPVPAHPTTPADRVGVVAHLLAHEGEYGLVTALSQT